MRSCKQVMKEWNSNRFLRCHDPFDFICDILSLSQTTAQEPINQTVGYLKFNPNCMNLDGGGGGGGGGVVVYWSLILFIIM